MTTPYDDDHDDEPQTEPQPNWRRKLEADAKAGREAQAAAEAAKAEAAAAKRELMFLKLGIDPERGQGKLFAKAYDGEMDLEAMRQSAQEYGIIRPPEPQVSAEEQAAMARIQGAAGAGAVPSGDGFDFQAKLDSIPEFVRGEHGRLEPNPNFMADVLNATREQAAREGREFVISAGNVTAQKGYSLGPATTPIQ